MSLTKGEKNSLFNAISEVAHRVQFNEESGESTATEVVDLLDFLIGEEDINEVREIVKSEKNGQISIEQEINSLYEIVINHQAKLDDAKNGRR